MWKAEARGVASPDITQNKRGVGKKSVKKRAEAAGVSLVDSTHISATTNGGR